MVKEHQPDEINQKSVENTTDLSQHLRENRHTPISRKVEVIAKENNVAK